MSNASGTDHFVVTKEHRRFVEFCDACRRYRYIGLCYGHPGVGKTLSARTYTGWDQVETLLPHRYGDLEAAPEILACTTLFYTAPVSSTARRIEKEIMSLRTDFNYLLADMEVLLRDGHDADIAVKVPDKVELIIVDEADRLKTAGLEQLRDFYDRGKLGLVLIGMPGIEKRLSRYPQLYSRVGFVHHFQPLSTEEMQFILQNKWEQLGLTLDLADYTDAEALAAIIRIVGGNFRLLERLMSQIERVMKINEVRTLTKEVVETAREALIIGP